VTYLEWHIGSAASGGAGTLVTDSRRGAESHARSRTRTLDRARDCSGAWRYANNDDLALLPSNHTHDDTRHTSKRVYVKRVRAGTRER